MLSLYFNYFINIYFDNEIRIHGIDIYFLFGLLNYDFKVRHIVQHLLK